MSAPTEENKKPAGIESFLIVAYRSLRGRKSGVSYRERNLIDASAEKIKTMAKNIKLVAKAQPGIATVLRCETGLHSRNLSIVFFKKASVRAPNKLLKISYKNPAAKGSLSDTSVPIRDAAR